jgi:hypothetical protein
LEHQSPAPANIISTIASRINYFFGTVLEHTRRRKYEAQNGARDPLELENYHL